MSKLQRFTASRLAAPLVFLVSLAFFLAGMDLRANSFDEGLILTGAANVADGKVPHRDFYAVYGPAQFYILATIFKVTGPSFLAARFYDLLVRAAIVALAYRLLAGRTSSGLALTGAGLCFMWLFGAGTFLYPMFPTLLLALAGTAFLIPKENIGGEGKRTLLAGALTGLIALFRYDVGFFVASAHVTALALMAGWERGSRGHRFMPMFRQVFTYATGTAIVFVPIATLLLFAGAGAGFVHDILEYPPAYYSQMRGLPFPGAGTMLASPYEAAIYFPFVAVPLAAAAWFWSRRGRAAFSRSDDAFLLLLTTLTLFLTLKGLVRIQVIHLLIAIIPSTILMTFLVGHVKGWPWGFGLAMALTALLSVIPASHQAAGLARDLLMEPRLSFAGTVLGLEGRAAGTAKARSAHFAPGRASPEMICAAEFLAAVSAPGEPIFSGLMRHDKILMNNVTIYFAADRRPATHWYQMDPGLQTRADVQADIIEHLKAAGVRWVVRESTWDNAREPNESALSSGVRLLDHYLAERYRPVATFGKISVWLVKHQQFSPADKFRCSA